MAEAKRDENFVPTLIGVSSADGTTPVRVYVDPTTHRLLVDLTGAGSGTVTSVSVVSANGLAGTVATATSTPAITLSTTITGILEGNGTAISAASTTGSGAVVLATSATLVTPVLGEASGTGLTLSGLTASEMVITNGSKKLVSAAVATYPNLTELTYLKGVTSSIQTQLNAKGAGDVTAGANMTDNTIVRGDGGAKGVQDSGITVSDTDAVSGIGDITGVAAGITIATATNGQITIRPGGSGQATYSAGSGGVLLSTTAGNADITLTPHGTGDVIVSSGTASEIAIFDASKGLQGAAVATYPSLTELTYVKGVTSAIQTQFTAKAPLASPTFTGTVTTPATNVTGDVDMQDSDIILGNATSETSSILLNDSALADEKWSGITEIGTAGATLAVGDLCYLASSGKWVLTDGILDGTDTGFDKRIGICVDASTDTNPTEMLLRGVIASAAFPTFTVGSAVYMSDTAGDMVVAQPSTTNFAIRIMGYARSATVIDFNPSPDYIVHV